MRLLAAICLLSALTAVSACNDPRIGANFGFGARGMTVSPSLSGRIGGARLSISG